MSNPIHPRALEQAIAAVEEGLRESAEYSHLSTPRDGVIRRYRIAIEAAGQLISRVLLERFGIDEAPARKDTFREAARLGLIADAQAWIGHLNALNRTSHTYDSEVAELVFRHIPSFPEDARDLLRRLEPHVG
jgi:nucleotidyltransferase substrate binding protein (TIGR01987 family)